MEFRAEYLPIDDIKPYAGNAKLHDKRQIDNVAESIRQFGFAQPVVVDRNNEIIIGHCRVLAARKLGMESVPCVRMDELDDEQVQKLRLLDNKLNESDWDFDLLAEQIPELDFSEFDIDWNIPEIDDTPTTSSNPSLMDRFVIPPFSVLDTRQGYWQDRKREWIAQGIDSAKGRDENLIGAPDTEELDYVYTKMKGIAPQTSVFDPVLAEIMYRWYCPDEGTIYDCFAGGSVRGIVAAMLGHQYIGIDLRQEQVDENYEQAAQLELSPVWICDDSLNADRHIQDDSADMVFTCPPYADLEKYSDDERDISNMEYEDFCKVYRDILHIAARKLKDDRFFVVVIGDVRDQKGAYRQLVDYTRKCLTEAGLVLYNDFVLLEQVGTGAIRAARLFNTMRKVVKTHQNVLCFYKGDIQHIKNNFSELDLTEDDIQ